MRKRILLTGNEAIARAAIDAGCGCYAGYPITPQNELIAYMAQHLPQSGGVFIQAESELAAINMVFGAAAAGARAMTSTSSPGMSLKQEGISYIAGAELPAVIVNIMRGGPGLGNIWPAQSDYFQATRGGGHGDYHSLVLAPASVQEAYDLTRLAFDLADQYRNQVIILGDGMLGQMMEPLAVNSRWSIVNGQRKELSTIDHRPSTKNWALTGCVGRKPRVVKSFFMHEGELEKHNLGLQKKYARICGKQQMLEDVYGDKAKVFVVAYGIMARIAKAAIGNLRSRGQKVGLLRPISLWPFPGDIIRRIAAGNPGVAFGVVEMSYGQMVQDVQLALGGKSPVTFLGRSGGGIPSQAEIERFIGKLLNGEWLNYD